MAAEAPELFDDAVEEVLLHCRPDDPAFLFRAALVCKRWLRLVYGPGFRRRYAERHRAAAPALGFVCNLAAVYPEDAAHFVPASSPSPFPASAHREARALDARHGRVLLLHGSPKKVAAEMRLAVWDPVTGLRRKLPSPPVAVRPTFWNAAVLCAAAGCDHVDCHRGPFRVIIVGVHSDQMYMYSCVYSSSEPRGGWWSVRGASFPDPDCSFKLKPSALARNALHFVFTSRISTATGILKYDLETREMSAIQLPRTGISPRIALATMESGGLGFVMVGLCKLHLWSRVDDHGRDAGWYQSRVVDLKRLLPANALSDPATTVGFAGGAGTIFLGTEVGNFVIDLKFNQARKLDDDRMFHGVFPFTSFCIPALGASSSGEKQQAGTQIKVLHN